jgi:penicillin amidase
MNWPRALLRTLGRRLPPVDGTIAVPGLAAPVLIRRNRFGVPQIDAAGDTDAWFGLGFCQGQDRAFQLETRLRVARGTIAALIGRDGLEIDELSRRVGFRRHGERGLEVLSPPHRAGFEAFAAGVRAGVERGGGGRAHEFTLLRSRPSRFEAADALALLALQAFALASNWDVELARLRMLSLDGPEAVAALNPPYPEDHPVSDRPGHAAARTIDALAADLAAAGPLFAPGAGSNNWAISGTRTRSGRPVLANDPHLAPLLPAHWYLARVTTPDWTITGASVPGIPSFGAGHNGHAAWGVTAGLIDNTDLFVEEVGTDGASVKRGDRFVPCESRSEVIEIKGADPVTITILETDRGPIVGPAFQGEFGALSMSATWLQVGSLGASLEVGRLRSLDDLRRTYASWPSVPLNIAYADAAGTIGWQLIGDAPRRGRGGGTIPLPAADPATRWTDGPLPSGDLPGITDPGEGFVATANNLPSSDGTYRGSDFLDGYRVSRITDLLASRSDWDVASSLAMQLDRYSIPWHRLRGAVLAAAESAGDLDEIGEMLRGWDGVLATDSAPATVFEVFVALLARAIAEAKAPNSARYALGAGFSPLIPFNSLVVRRVSHLVRLVDDRPEGWFALGWDEALRAALRDARGLITARLGPDPTSWHWGQVRQVRFRHPLGARPWLARIFDLGPVPHGGDANTINPAHVDPMDPLGNPDFAVASLRMVVDVGAFEHSRFALPGGQSGNPFSPHYADQLPLWEKGDGMTIAQDEVEVTRVTRHTLRLLSAT